MGNGTSWNDIPWNPNESPEEKAKQFDAQIEENRQAAQAKDEDA